MEKKKISGLPVAQGYTSDTVIAIDDAANGTRQLLLSKVIGSFVPMTIVPDWGSQKGVDYTSETDKQASKNGYILFKSFPNWGGDAQYGYVNDVAVFQFVGDLHDYASCPYGVVPVSEGDRIKVSSATYVSATFYPAKSVPVANSTFKAKIKQLAASDTYLSATAFDAQDTNDYATAMSDKVNAADLSYDLSAVAGGFADRAVNTVTMNGNLTMALPTQVSGKVRDFVVTLTVTAAGTLTVTGLDHYYYDAGTADPITTAFEAGKTYRLYFTEANAGVFRIGRTELVYK